MYKWLFGLLAFLSLCLSVGCYSTTSKSVKTDMIQTQQYNTLELLYLYEGSIEIQPFKVPAELPDFTLGDVETEALVSNYLYITIYVYNECTYIVFLTVPKEIAPKVDIIALATEWNDRSKNKYWIYQNSLPVSVSETSLVEYVGNIIKEVSGTGSSDKKSNI